MNDQKKLKTYVYIDEQEQASGRDVELYTLRGACSDEFFLRVYLSLQCIYSEFMIPCKSLPFQLPDGSMYITFTTHTGFSSYAKRFLTKIPMRHRIG